MAYYIIKTYAKLQVLFTISVFGISGIHLHIPPSLYCVCPHSIHLVAVIDRSRNSRHPRNPRISKGATFDFSTDGFFHGIQRQEIHGLYNPIKITLLRVIPTMTFIHFLTGKSSGILSDISSDILFDILSGISSGI